MAYDPDIAALADQLTSSGSSYGALAPGSLPSGDYSGSQYYPGGGDWWDRNLGMNSGISNADTTKALAGLAKGFDDQQKNQQSGKMGPLGAGGPSGQPRRAVDLNALVQKLIQQQQAYQNSAMGLGQNPGQPIPAPRTIGLLGF